MTISDNDQVYFRQNVLVEPLVGQWYAWPGLIPPATAAMYLANWHVKIMQSFVSNPQMHVQALKNPAMLGGPFIGHPPARVGEIKELLDRTTAERRPLLQMADDIKSLQATLWNEAQGFSLEPLYQKIPESLKGYTELVYNSNNNASIRFLEGLLYRSPYHDRSAQSVMMSLIAGDGRGFTFSTPRLPDENSLHLRVPFDSAALDTLFRMKSAPAPYGRVKEELGVAAADEPLFSSFFTAEAPRPPERYSGEGVRVRYFGHACLLVESKDASVLLDPVVSYDFEGGDGRYTFADLPETIDYVVITHNHQDHCLFETLLQLRHKVRNVLVPASNYGKLTDPSLRLVLQTIGFPDVREVSPLESVEVPGGRVTAFPFFGEHADLDIRTKSSYLVELGGHSVLCMADSNNLAHDLYRPAREAVGRVEALFLGMECDGAPMSWLYGPLLARPVSRGMDQSRRLDGSTCEKALDLVSLFDPRQVYVYAMGQEPWLTYLTSIQYTDESRPIVESDKLVAECRRRDLVSERLFGQKEIHLR